MGPTTGISDATLLRSLAEDVPDMAPEIREQLRAIAAKLSAALRSEQAPAGEDERKAFDKWHTRYGKGFVAYSEFNGVELTAAWKAWRARAALSTPPAGEGEAKLKDDVGPRDFGIPPEHCEAAKHYAAFMLDRALSTPPAVPHVDDLAWFIRTVDGNNSMGAGMLAERICDWLSAAPAAPHDTPQLVPKWAGEFRRFSDWVNHAQDALKSPSHAPAICVDAKGRRCASGKDFARARDEDAFPVRYFWECQGAAPQPQKEQP